MLLAGNDIQHRRIQGVRASAAVVFGILITISHAGRAEHGPVRLDISVHIQHRRRVIPRYAGKIKVKEDLWIPDDRFIDLFPELREGIPDLHGITVVVLDGVKAVLQQLLFPGGGGVFQLAMVQDKSPDLVKIPVQLRGAQAEIVLQQPLRGVRPASGDLREESGRGFLLILIRQFFNILPDIRQVRSVFRRCIVKSVSFRVQNTAGAFAGRDLLIEDLFLIRQIAAVRQDLPEQGRGSAFGRLSLFTAALEHIQASQAQLFFAGAQQPLNALIDLCLLLLFQ